MNVGRTVTLAQNQIYQKETLIDFQSQGIALMFSEVCNIFKTYPTSVCQCRYLHFGFKVQQPRGLSIFPWIIWNQSTLPPGGSNSMGTSIRFIR